MAKSKYESHVKPRLETIRAWKRKGVTDKAIAEALKISLETFYQYVKAYPEFSDALKEGLDDCVSLVEGAHFKAAMGYEYEETKVIIEPTDKVDEGGNPITRRKIEKTTKHVPGNVTAQIHFLKNRAPKDWHDRKELAIGGVDGEELVIRVKHVRSDD